LCAHSNV
jgi:hypothetical protein